MAKGSGGSGGGGGGRAGGGSTQTAVSIVRDAPPRGLTISQVAQSLGVSLADASAQLATAALRGRVRQISGGRFVKP